MVTNATSATSAAFLSSWIEDAAAKPPSRPSRRKTLADAPPPPFLRRYDAAGVGDAPSPSPVCVSSSRKLHMDLKKLPITNGGDGDDVDPNTATNDKHSRRRKTSSRKKSLSFGGRRRATVDDLPAPSAGLFADVLYRKSKSAHASPPIARPEGQRLRGSEGMKTSHGGRRRSTNTGEPDVGGYASSSWEPNPSSANGSSHGSRRLSPAPQHLQRTSPMHLPDRSLGDFATRDDALHQPFTDPFRVLRVHDFVWLRRTRGGWTYAILADFCKIGNEDAMRFVVDSRGTTKKLKGKHVEKSLRLVNAVDYRNFDR